MAEQRRSLNVHKMQNHIQISKLLLTAAFLGLMFVVNARSQEETVTLQFVTFPKWTTRIPIEMAIGNGETIEITAPSNGFSKPHEVPKLANWIFGRSGVDEKGDPVFDTFAQGKSLNTPHQLILLIRKNNDPADGMQVIALDSSESKFKGGEFFFMNVSDFDVAGQMGESRFMIKPAQHRIVSPTAKDIHTREGIPFIQTVLFYRKNEESNPFFSSTWHVNPKARSMIFFYHSGKNNRLRMHTIQDFMP
jgi:hypothetical protein